jgi:hypothetical protein
MHAAFRGVCLKVYHHRRPSQRKTREEKFFFTPTCVYLFTLSLDFFLWAAQCNVQERKRTERDKRENRTLLSPGLCHNFAPTGEAVDQLGHHFLRDGCPLRLSDCDELLMGGGVLLCYLIVQVGPQILYGVEIRAPGRPIGDDIDLILPEELYSVFSCVTTSPILQE